MVFISWDELPSEERPPKRMWRDGKALKEWFEAVTSNRKRDMDPKVQQIEDPKENEAAKGLIVGG